LRWSDWDDEKQTLMICRSGWNTKVGGTKNAASEGSIPVLPLLNDLLRTRRERVKPNPQDYIFAGTKRGTPLDFHNLAHRVIKPALEKSKLSNEGGVQWEGFYGFRHELASNLFGLGVNPKVIAAILRHSDISTTLQFYIQTPDAESRAALAKVEERIASRPSGFIMSGPK
jgi:integrase